MNTPARLASLGLLSALLVLPSRARADEYDDAVPLTPLTPAPSPAPAAVAPPARAATAPASTTSTTIDSVHTRAGALYRGRVLEILPNSHVTLEIPGQGTKRFAWADVEKVVVASYTGPLPPSSSAGTPSYNAGTAPLDAPMAGPRARVHIHAKGRVILYRRPAGSNAWSQACASPCDTELPIGDTYRLTGNGVPQSKEFKLEAPAGGAVEISYDPPSTGGIILGGTLAYGGALTAYVGLIMALAGADGGSYSSSDKDLRDAGLITMLVGAGVGALGLVVFLNSSKTDIEQKSSGARSNEAFVRQPSWKTISGARETAQAPAATFPVLFSKSF